MPLGTCGDPWGVGVSYERGTPVATVEGMHGGHDGVNEALHPLGPWGFSNPQHRRTPEMVL